ncbi:hypothetical protein BT96DRAFT_948562 [Gymnopus androsaceus JB14]|uniref:CHAT domain-containing protein n=1 Tax=Gymnopus androsaceus JB14 TaxID=1447944 RepID=A0A6A4GP10_9AGAR|nr:hypothetical protein BT96DRAFT_948562 [Gymnopus androsaceus JB14]
MPGMIPFPHEWLSAPKYWYMSAIEAYRIFFQLLNRFLINIQDVTNQHTCLASLPDSIASDAAACAIQAGKLDKAVELLEYGQDLIVTNLQILRLPCSDEQQRKADSLLDEFCQINPEGSQEQAKLSRIAHIKKQWRNFLKPKLFSELRKANAEGPMIIVNTSTFRNNVLILHSGQGSPEHITLDGVHLNNMTNFSKVFQGIGEILHLPQHDSRATCPVNIGSLRNTESLLNIFNAPHGVFSLISSELADLRVPKHSRIWWMLPGKSTFLLCHAVVQEYISSYTTNLSALIDAWHQKAKDNATELPSLLAVGVEKYTKASSLPSVKEELDSIQELDLSQIKLNVTVLRNTDATKTNVLRKLQNHSSVHFACHGTLPDASHELHNPFDLALILSSDEELMLCEIMTSVAKTNSDSAFLSACHTVTTEQSKVHESHPVLQ